MWKKPDKGTSEPPAPVPRPNPVTSTQSVTEQSLLGSALRIDGDLTGTEDVVIQGEVDGKVNLKKNSVTVGKNGRVKADIYAACIFVEGKVQGNLFGSEKVVIRKSGSVRGNISGPRVNLEDGARFKGSIDMEGGQEQAQPATPSRSKDQKHQDDKQVAVVATNSDTKTQNSREGEKSSLRFKLGSSSSKP